MTIKSIRSVAYLKVLTVVFPSLAILLHMLSSLPDFFSPQTALALAAFGSLLASGAVLKIWHKIGIPTETVPNGGRCPNKALHEKLASDVDQIRRFKMQKKFDLALRKADDVLARDPNFSEVWYLKANILWEGYQDPSALLDCCAKMAASTAKSDPHHRWSQHLMHQLSRHPDSAERAPQVS